MPRSGCSALHGVNPNLKKKNSPIKVAKLTPEVYDQKIKVKNRTTLLVI